MKQIEHGDTVHHLTKAASATGLFEAISLTLLTLLAIAGAYKLDTEQSLTPTLHWETVSTRLHNRQSTLTVPHANPSLSLPNPNFTQVATITVATDGHGDYTTLSDALQAAPAWATILLGPETFSLTASLTLTQPIRLIGAGRDTTRIIAATEAYVVHTTADFIAESLSTLKNIGRTGNGMDRPSKLADSIT